MTDHGRRPERSPVPLPGSDKEEPGRQSLRVILPEEPPTLSLAAAAVLLRILRAAERHRIAGRTSEHEREDNQKRRAA
jgi:hypothetical protein